MYCAALLAKAGKRVLVLEQHTAAGGCTRCHEDKGWGFDTGLHSVGQIDKYGHLLDIVSDGPKVQWRKLGTEADGFTRDEIVIGDGSPYKYRAGKQTFLDDLIAAFPEEEQSLREYLKLVIECSEQSKSHFFGKLFPRWVERLIENTVGCRFQRLASLTVSQVLDHLFVSSALKALLSSQFGAYGLPPDQASFFAHAAVVSHYLEGAHYPIGGPQEISRALIPTIIAAGGRVLVNAPVKNILSSPSGAAIGVEIEDNLTRIFAPVVISAAGAFATESIMNRAPLLQPEMKSLLSGISHVYAFIGMEGSSQQLQLPSFNTWVIPGEDINSDCREYYEHPFASDKQLMFISFPSAKDPLYSKKYPKKSNCIIIAEALPEWFEDYPTCNTGDTPKTYDALKLHFKNKLLQGLYKLFPHLDGRIRYKPVLLCDFISIILNK